ncbi:MAG: hypothetical protein U5K37_08390 [Natrialbaceae archaeon]|nr:hypothetical protein [Natrialbaceae archaeon]
MCEVQDSHDGTGTLVPPGAKFVRTSLRLVALVGIGLFVLLIASSAMTAATPVDCSGVNYDGTGSATSPWEVENPNQLQCIGSNQTPTEMDDDFEQTADIDASVTQSWDGGAGFLPIGTNSSSMWFTGTYDGKGHAIKNLTINRPGLESVGLFNRTASSAIILDLTVTDATVRGATEPFGKLGVLTGQTFETTIQDISIEGSINSFSTHYVGGIAGEAIGGSIQRTSVNISVATDAGIHRGNHGARTSNDRCPDHCERLITWRDCWGNRRNLSPWRRPPVGEYCECR